MNIISVVE